MLQAVGKFPAYKELFSEYVWSDSGNAAKEGQDTHTAGTKQMHISLLFRS